MSEEKADDGILGRAKRLADQVGEYARSDEARDKLDGVKKNAIKAGGMAMTGAKRLAGGTKQAAAQAKLKADDFSKSEKGEALKAKAKEDWDEIRGGTFRGSRLSESPVVVGLAIILIFPVGLYLLWKHPVLGRRRTWWWAGGTWGLLLSLIALGRNGDEAASPRAQALRQVELAGGPAPDGRAGAKHSVLDGQPEGITPEAVLAIVEPLSVTGIDYSKGPRGETLVSRDGFDEDAKKPATESGFIDPDGMFVLHGPRTTWFEAPTGQSSGRRLYESFYFEGERHGIHREWRESGEKEIERTYKRGKIHGVGIWYYKSGRIGAIQEFKEDHRDGLDCKWHENGRIESVERFRTDVVEGETQTTPVGRYRSWFGDGTPNYELSYDDGEVDGYTRRVERLPGGRPVVTIWKDGNIVFDRATCNMRTFHRRMWKLASSHADDGAKLMFKSASEFFRKVGPPDPGSIVYNNYDSDDVPWGFRCTYRCSDGDLSVLARSVTGTLMVFVNPEDTLR